MTELIQIIGRSTRDAPNKIHAQFTNLIAEPDAVQGEVVGAVNDMLKAISASLLEEGLHYHEAHELEDCLFCGNSLLGDRRAQLKSLFDKSWTDALNALQNSISKGRDFQRDLRETQS